MMSTWGTFIMVLLIAMHLLTGTRANFAGIKYFMATCGQQNCNSVCATFGLQCAGTGQSFPPSSVLQIFESLGIKCKTNNYTDVYTYEDQPNYMVDSPDVIEGWAGTCMGFKSIPSTINCHIANNSFVRRLCPCFDPSATQPTLPSAATLITKKLTATSETKPATPTDSTHVTQEHSTGNDAPEPQRQTGGTSDVERTALIVVAILAAGLALCLVGLAFLFFWNKRQLREKTEEELDSAKLHVQYHKNNDEADVADMMDGLAVEIETEEENGYCAMRTADLLHTPKASEMEAKDSATEPSTGSEETVNSGFIAEGSMPVYDRLV